MSWGSGFITQLSAAVKVPQWELVVERTPLGATGTAYVSHAGLVAGVPALISRAPLFSPNRIQPVSWTPSAGTWSVEIAWTDCHRAIGMCPRGAIVSLYCTLAGNRERVALGIVRNLTGAPQAFRIECQTLTSGLTSRLVTDPDEAQLFADLNDGDTTVASNYTAGDATLVLTDGSGLEKDTDTGGLYCVLVTATSGSQFYVTGTLAANTITITTAGAFGTTDANAAATNAVTACAFINGHPLDIARKLLISGSGSATWDTLPDKWGLTLDGSWFSHGDINDVRDNVMVCTSGTYAWDVVVSAPVDSPWSWFQGLLSRSGAWLTMRQGDITFRAAQEPGSPLLGSVGTIGDEMLAKTQGPSWSWQYQAQEFPIEYGFIKVQTATGFAYEPTSLGLIAYESYPALVDCTYDLSVLVFSNETQIRDADADRLVLYAVYPPEAFSMSLRGWAAAAWCEGDFITLDLEQLRGRQTDSGYSYEGATAVVLESAPDFGGDTTRVRLIVFPQET